MKTFKTYPGLYRGCKLTGFNEVSFGNVTILQAIEYCTPRWKKELNEQLQQEFDDWIYRNLMIGF